jgi:hypothetical protein
MALQIRTFLLALLLTMALAGCRQGNDFLASITAFQESTEKATAAIKTYYSALNQYERDLYLQERLMDESLRVAIKDRQGNPTPLLFQPFNPEALEGRIDLLRQIALYGQQLASLAGNQAPEKTRKNLGSLADGLANLNTRFEGLSKSNDPEAGKYLGPIGTILGIVSKHVLEKRKTNAVRNAIREGQKPVDSILIFLEQDLNKYVAATRNTGQRQEVAAWVNYYNRHVGKLSFAQRQQILQHINRAALELELVKQSQPSDVVSALRKTHAALVQYAGSSGKPADLGSLMRSLKSFQEEAQQLVEAAATLQKLTSEG